MVLISQFSNDKLLLLETLFDNTDFLGVSKGVLRLDDFLKLTTETSTFVNVKLHFNLYLSELRRFDVTL